MATIMQRRCRKRRFRPALDPLESRECQTITGLQAVVAPQILKPPNGRFVTVTVKGEIGESGKQAPIVKFQVIDEYRQVQPGGRVKLVLVEPGRYKFAFQAALQATVASNDKPGRLYFISIAAEDAQGSLGQMLHVLVPNPNSGASTSAKPRKR
jgi:hypothetical protein